MSAMKAIPSVDEIWSWHRTLSNWGRWGVDDERGTLNLITPAKCLQAAQLVREGLVISCARTIGYEPAADNVMPARHFMLSSGEAEPEQILGRAATDVFVLQPHGVSMTHLDAIPYSRRTWTRPKLRRVCEWSRATSCSREPDFRGVAPNSVLAQ